MQPNTLLYNPDESQGWPLNHALIEIEFIAVKPAGSLLMPDAFISYFCRGIY